MMAERQRNAKRQHQRRQQMTEEQREAQRAADAERILQRLAALEEEERAAERAARAERQRQRREELEEEERVAERAANAERMRQRHEDQEEQERDAERAANAERERCRRQARNRDRAGRAACRADLVLSGDQPVPYFDIDRRVVPCAHCCALLWRGEQSICCARGKVWLDPVPAPPSLLRYLWTSDDPVGRAFHENARRLNCGLALTSQQVCQVVVARGGPYRLCVIIQGRMFHRLGPLQPREGETPAFVQLYVSDPQCDHPEREVALRLGHVPLPASIPAATQRWLHQLLEQLQVLLRDKNLYVRDFIHVAELPDEEVEHRQLVISTED